jgi:hypothetical protein
VVGNILRYIHAVLYKMKIRHRWNIGRLIITCHSCFFLYSRADCVLQLTRRIVFFFCPQGTWAFYTLITVRAAKSRHNRKMSDSTTGVKVFKTSLLKSCLLNLVQKKEGRFLSSLLWPLNSQIA